MIELLYLVIAAFAVVALIWILTFISRKTKVRSTSALVVSKKIEHGMFGTQIPQSSKFTLVFKLENGEKRSFNISESDYHKTPENKWGTLCYQGFEPISFINEDLNIEFR